MVSTTVGAEGLGGRADARAGGDIGVVRDAGGNAGSRLDDDLVALGDEFLDRFRRGGHAELARVDLGGDSDLHRGADGSKQGSADRPRRTE